METFLLILNDISFDEFRGGAAALNEEISEFDIKLFDQWSHEVINNIISFKYDKNKYRRNIGIVMENIYKIYHMNVYHDNNFDLLIIDDENEIYKTSFIRNAATLKYLKEKCASLIRIYQLDAN
jgi:ABC-type ATPase involved in cell division